MEGACGKILSTEDPSVVIKKIHRRKRAHQRSASHTAEEQARLQDWSSRLCRTFPILSVPRAWDAERFQYKMERIDTETPLQDIKGHPVHSDLKAFYDAAKKVSVFPADYELYVQPDGSVAMVDFDKFGIWNPDGSVLFPWGLTLTPEQVEELLQHIL